ncbi:PulJ/GspJ family protein [Oleiharenicola lentus]|uniref:PulJ/GspJ family protein n=1 Tax=Oleiharenicola lentus TaxID=2508720 RepID=UPI003F676C40
MNKACTQAFTLLELLVAVTITLVLAGIMLSVTTNTLTVWKRTQDGFSGSTQAKLALDMIERDLQSACHARTAVGNNWLAVDVVNSTAGLSGRGWLSSAFMKPATALSLSLVPPTSVIEPTIGDTRFGLSGAWLRFIAATAESSTQLALPRALSYQIVRRPVSGTVSATNPADVRYTLYRTFINNDDTFSSGYNVTAYGANLSNPSSSSDALATNVVDLAVWLYARDASGRLQRIFPASASDTTHRATDAVTPNPENQFPDVAEIMLRVLTEEGARILAAMEGGSGQISRPPAFATDDAWWWSVVEAHSRVFMRRVEIKARGL